MPRAYRAVALPVLLLTAGASPRPPSHAAVGEQPLGTRPDLVGATIKSGDDSFTGVHPVFVIDSA